MTHPVFAAIDKNDFSQFKALLSDELAKPDGVTALERLSDGGHSLATLVAQTGNVPMMKLLVDARLGLGAPEPGGLSPLHFAAERGHESMVALLLRSSYLGADVNAQSDLGETAAHLAAEKGHVKVLSSLELAGAKMTSPTRRGDLPSHFGARGGHADVIDFLNLVAAPTLVARNLDGDTPAHHAAAADQGAAIAALYRHKGMTALSAQDNDGNQPLHVAAISGSSMAVKALLDAGVPPATPSRDGVTAQMAAQQEGHQGVLNQLTPQWQQVMARAGAGAGAGAGAASPARSGPGLIAS